MGRASLAGRVRGLLDWFGQHARDLPWRRSTDPYGVWVSEIMLQQTQVKTVIPYWERWMRELPGIGPLAGAPEFRVLKLWEGLGYYRRARHLQAAARRIQAEHGGRFPSDREAVLALPGIGRYTAGAICSIAFNQPEPILDGNVIRVLTRLHAWAGDPRASELNARLWEEARRWVGTAAATARPAACSQINQGLMELGATVCLPRDPACDRCPLATGCRARRQGAPESYPCLAARPETTPRHFITLVANFAGRFAICQRPRDGVNGSLWEFPNAEVTLPWPDPAELVGRLVGSGGAAPRRWMEIRHAITRYRIQQRVFRVEFARAPRRRVGLLWRTLDELEGLAFTSAHRRLVHRLGAERLQFS